MFLLEFGPSQEQYLSAVPLSEYEWKPCPRSYTYDVKQLKGSNLISNLQSLAQVLLFLLDYRFE